MLWSPLAEMTKFIQSTPEARGALGSRRLGMRAMDVTFPFHFVNSRQDVGSIRHLGNGLRADEGGHFKPEMPVSARPSMMATLCSVGMNSFTLWKPSARPP